MKPTYLFVFFLLLGIGLLCQLPTAKAQAPANKLSPCQLPRLVEGPIALGFPKVPKLAPSLGQLNMTVLFVDFDDVPASSSTDSVFAIINPLVPNFFAETSYGRLQLQLQPHHAWLRLSRPSAHYGEGIYGFETHRAFIQEAVDLADAQVDFSKTDVVLVLSNPKAKAIPLGPTFKVQDPYWQIKADGASISSAITSGYDLNYWGGIWLAHETGHTWGLPDLYHFGNEGWNKYVGTFGLMGTCGATAPGYFAFERWVLGWLYDAQVLCHDAGELLIEIEALEKPGGIKAVMVPIDSTTALVVECRRKMGFDKNMTKAGALVYVVNTALEGGSGPIQVKPGQPGATEFLLEAPMAQGDSYTYGNIYLEVLEAKGESDRLKVVVK
ncbi:MAG: hypothetical protein Q8J69_10855 [Sphingobacteriaceae bacterium]|nr:hypothetical protein [Sphingobacteriaceae bacterium]